jgi:hypothetical protein
MQDAAAAEGSQDALSALCDGSTPISRCPDLGLVLGCPGTLGDVPQASWCAQFGTEYQGVVCGLVVVVVQTGIDGGLSYWYDATTKTLVAITRFVNGGETCVAGALDLAASCRDQMTQVTFPCGDASTDAALDSPGD